MVKQKLLDQARDTIRTRHLSYRTEQAYIYWIRKFILFHQKLHPLEMGEAEVGQFLTYLKVYLTARFARGTEIAEDLCF